MKEMIHTTHYVTLKIDVIKIILLLTAASALVEFSMATTVAKDNKGGYIALMTDAQQLSEAAMQLEQQQQQQQLPVEPFNFANLRRLHLKYKNGQSYANRRQGQQQVQAQQLRKEQQQQQQQQQPQRQKQQQLQQMLEQQELQQRLQQQQPRKQQWQQISRYNNKEQRDQDNNDVDDSDSDSDNDNENDNNSRSAERESGMESRNNDKDDNGYLYYRYLYSDDNNNNNKQPNGNGNPNRDDDDDDDDDDNYDYQEQHRQEGRNSFRLQLSGSNEPFRSTTNNKNNNNNNNNGNKNHNNNINDIHNNSDNNNIDADDDNDGDTVAKANNKSFSDHPDQDSDMLSFGDVEFYDDLEVSLPYGIQNVKRVPQRNVNHVGKTTTFQSLCPTKRVSIPLDTSAYEYRPNHYIEVTCAHVYSPTENTEGPNKNRICSEAGFSCVQLNRTIHLIRRNKAAISSRSSADCWESEIRIVSSGCECMWPKHHYGDIVTYHHQEQKRHQVAWGELGDVKENEDYAEIPFNGDAYKMIRERNNIFTMPLN